MKKIPIFLLYILIIILQSCKGDEAKPKTKSQLLTQNEWKGDKATFTASSLVINQTQEQGITETTLKFNTDGTFVARSTTGTDSNGTWELLNNNTQIKLKSASLIDLTQLQILLPQGTTLPPIPELFDIVELSEKTFIFKGKTNFNVPVQGIIFPVPVQIDFTLKFMRP